MANENLSTAFQDTLRRLTNIDRKDQMLTAAVVLLKSLFWIIAGIVAFVVLDWLLQAPTIARLLCSLSILATLLFVSVRYFLPLLQKASLARLMSLARRVGEQDPAVNDAIINFVQIYSDRNESDPENPFRDLPLKQLHQRFGSLPFDKVLDPSKLRKPAAHLVGMLVVFMLLAAVAPAPFSESIQKLAFPLRSFEKPLPVTLKVHTGDQIVLKNAGINLAGSYSGVTPHRLWMILETSVGEDSLSREKLEIPVKSGKDFNYRLEPAKFSFTYWFEAALDLPAYRGRTASSAVHRITVRDRPHVREVQVRLDYPGYTGIPANLLPANNGEISALKGTKATIDIVANKQLSAAWLHFQDSSRVMLQVMENRARGSFTVDRDGQYQVMLLDADSVDNFQPIQYAVFALADEMPYVEITTPGEDVDLGEALQLPLAVNIRDDFGFRGLSIKGRHIKAGTSGDTSAFSFPLSIRRSSAQQGSAVQNWDLKPFYLVPDDYIEYHAEVIDNDAVSGPKRSTSETYIVRLPSIVEFLEEVDRQLSDRIEETGEVAREAEALREKLEEINREMKRENSLSWERQQEIQHQIDQQKAAAEKLEQIRQDVEQMANQLDKNDMLSPETLEKFSELQKMLEELATPEFQEAMRKLEEAMEEADMEKVRQAMEEFQLTAEQFSERIERTYELFKQVEMEQKMDELVQLADKLSEEQQEINEALKQEELSQSEQEQLAGQEENLQQNTEYLKEKLEEAQKLFQENQAETAQDLQEAGEYMDQQQISEQMQQMSQQMQQGQMQQAQKQGQKLEQQLNQMQSMMQQARQNMNQAQKQEVMMAMKRAQQDMLRASFDQEQLAEKSAGSDVASSQMNDLARQQSQMRDNTRKMMQQIQDISKKTFFMSPQMNAMMNSLMNNMEGALQDLADRNPRGASKKQRQAMGDLNRAILSMQSSMDQLQMSGSASGFEKMMEQLQQMAGQQGQLNQEAMGMMPRPGQSGQPTPEQFGRMAAQQQMIQRSMESLNQQMGQRQDMLGRLGDLGQEMEKVIEELRRQRLDPKVIERQQQILSRMLDAQRSVREKEQSRKREAQRESVASSKSPPAIRQSVIARENALRKEMLEAMKQGYSTDYKSFIRAYYEILSRQNSQQPAN